MRDWKRLFEELDTRLAAISEERYCTGGRVLDQSRIKILGQMALLVQPEVASKLSPFATRDVDALIEGESNLCRTELKSILSKRGLEYDDLSSEIWLPRKHKFSEVFRGQKLIVEVLDPISALISKAVKAPDKNRVLVARGIEIYGDAMTRELEFYGVSKDKFTKGKGLEL